MDETLWQKCEPPWFPRRSPDGRWIIGGLGQVWRRKINGKWQYRQDEATFEEWADSQW